MEEPVVPDPTLIITVSQFSDLSLCLGVRVLHYFKDKTKTGDFDLYSFTEFSPAHCVQQVCNSPPHNSLT